MQHDNKYNRSFSNSYASYNGYLDKRDNTTGPYRPYKQVGVSEEEIKTLKAAANAPYSKTVNEGQMIQQEQNKFNREQRPPQPEFQQMSASDEGNKFRPATQQAIRTNQVKSGPVGTNLNKVEQPREDNTPSRVEHIEADKLYDLITNPRFHKSRNGAPAKLIVKIGADWCKPCKFLAPKLAQLSRDPRYNSILFFDVDAEKLGKNLGSIFKEVDAVPMTFSFVGGKKIRGVPGAEISEIQALCEEIL